MQAYLEEVGGKLNVDNWFEGSGWKAKINKIDDFIVGSTRVGQVRLEWWGDEQAVRMVLPQLERLMARNS